MHKISVTIDLTKIDRSRIIERKYTNRDGQEIVAKEYKMDVVQNKPENFKTITSGDGWAIVKQYFVTDAPTKEERTAQKKMNFIGDGVVFVDLKEEAVTKPSPSALPEYSAEEINPDDIPF
jgi:single-stranded DNA-binding protein